MNLKIKTSESSKKNSLKIAFLLCFLISVQFVFAQNQTIDFFPANWYNNHRQPFLFSLGCQLLQNCQGCHG